MFSATVCQNYKNLGYMLAFMIRTGVIIKCNTGTSGELESSSSEPLCKQFIHPFIYLLNHHVNKHPNGELLGKIKDILFIFISGKWGCKRESGKFYQTHSQMTHRIYLSCKHDAIVDQNSKIARHCVPIFLESNNHCIRLTSDNPENFIHDYCTYIISLIPSPLQFFQCSPHSHSN